MMQHWGVPFYAKRYNYNKLIYLSSYLIFKKNKYRDVRKQSGRLMINKYFIMK